MTTPARKRQAAKKPTKKTDAARRVVITVRISKDRKNEISTEIQLEACRNYCNARGWQIVHEFEDKGRSAFKRNARRPEYEEMLTWIEDGVPTRSSPTS